MCAHTFIFWRNGYALPENNEGFHYSNIYNFECWLSHSEKVLSTLKNKLQIIEICCNPVCHIVAKLYPPVKSSSVNFLDNLDNFHFVWMKFICFWNSLKRPTRNLAHFSYLLSRLFGSYHYFSYYLNVHAFDIFLPSRSWGILRSLLF